MHRTKYAWQRHPNFVVQGSSCQFPFDVVEEGVISKGDLQRSTVLPCDRFTVSDIAKVKVLLRHEVLIEENQFHHFVDKFLPCCIFSSVENSDFPFIPGDPEFSDDILKFSIESLFLDKASVCLSGVGVSGNLRRICGDGSIILVYVRSQSLQQPLTFGVHS